MSSNPPNCDDSGRQRDSERDTATANAGRTAGESNRQGGAGETVGRAFDSARNTLAQSGPKSQLTFTIGLFAVIGVGFGLTGTSSSRWSLATVAVSAAGFSPESS